MVELSPLRVYQTEFTVYLEVMIGFLEMMDHYYIQRELIKEELNIILNHTLRQLQFKEIVLQV